jgi:glutamine amidotransferase
MRIGLIDCQSGNFQSVRDALEYLEFDIVNVCTAADFTTVSHLILPGVGAFSTLMERLRENGFVEPLKEAALVRRQPLLGICVGMQVLASIGTEFGTHEGLGLIPGTVARISSEKTGVRVPHVGWNSVDVRGAAALFQNMDEAAPTFYFLHSYKFNPDDSLHIAASCEYGEALSAAVARDNVMGVQFHPEKSQRNGLQLLKNFAAI